MVAVFLPVLVCCGWLSHLFELVVCRKMVQKKLKEGPARCYFLAHVGVHHTGMALAEDDRDTGELGKCQVGRSGLSVF